MAFSKISKVDAENRVFRDNWWKNTHLFFLHRAVTVTRPVCLICSESFAVVQSGNIKCHYEAKHRHLEETYPQQSEVRAQKINELKAQYERSTRVVLSHSFAAQHRAYECSLRIQ